MGAWMDRCVERWMSVLVGGWMHGCIDGCMGV